MSDKSKVGPALQMVATVAYVTMLAIAFTSDKWIKTTVEGEDFSWSPYDAIITASTHHNFLSKTTFFTTLFFIIFGVMRICQISMASKSEDKSDEKSAPRMVLYAHWMAMQFSFALTLLLLFLFAGTHARFGVNQTIKVDVEDATESGAILFYVALGVACVEPFAAFVVSQMSSTLQAAMSYFGARGPSGKKVKKSKGQIGV